MPVAKEPKEHSIANPLHLGVKDARRMVDPDHRDVISQRDQ